MGSDRGMRSRRRGWMTWATERPVAVVAISMALSLGLIAQIPRLAFDTSFEGFLAEDHPARATLDRFRQSFGRSHPVILAVRVPGRVSEPTFLSALSDLHHELEAEVPFLRHITSLIDVRAISVDREGVRVSRLLEQRARTELDRERLEDRLDENPLYRSWVVSESGEYVFLTLEFEDRAPIEATSQAGLVQSVSGEFDFEADDEHGERPVTTEDDATIVAAVREIVGRHASDDFEVVVGGGAVIASTVGEIVQRDLVRLLIAASLVIGVLLQWALRNARSVLLVFGVVGLALGSTLGAMSWLGVPVGFGTQILPTFLLAVGVGYAVHLLVLFHDAQRTERDRRAAMERALENSARPILLTALSTMAGLASFAPVPLAPIAQVGLFAPLGIVTALFYSLFMLPAAVVLLPPAWSRGCERRLRWGDRIARLGRRCASAPGWVALAVAVAILLSLVGMGRLRLSHDPVAWLHERTQLPETVRLLDREMGGANHFDLLIEPLEGVDSRSGEVLRRLDALERELLADTSNAIRPGKILGLHTAVREMNQALHDGDPSFYRVPTDDRLVAQELLVFENGGRDALDRWAAPDSNALRLTLQLDWMDSYRAVPYAREVVAIARARLGDLAKVTPTGLFNLTNETFVSVLDSIVSSYLMAFGVIACLLLIVFGDPRIGLASLLPNLVPILGTLGWMGWMEIPITAFTLLVGSIALGLAVDDTIHFVHGFQRRRCAGASAMEAAEGTLATSGVAVLFTSAALIGGFLVFALGDLVALAEFGMMSAVAIGLALAADVVLSPALFVWLARSKPRRRARSKPTPDAGALATVSQE